MVDLRTGRLRKGKPSDRITLHTHLPYERRALCPTWHGFVMQVFGGDPNLVGYVRRAVGYSLTGETKEQCFFLAFGKGSNGKSTMLEALRHVLGDYGDSLPFSSLIQQDRSAIPNDIAKLPARRLVVASEMSESERLNEARIKILTGQDSIPARHLYREWFDFRPQAKFWLACNHRPRVCDDSHGFWRRIRPIPFDQTFEGDRADKDLPAKLQAEGPGILAWLVRGAVEWYSEGLGELPQMVEKATEEYRIASDAFGHFLEERCVIHEAAKVGLTELWEEYQLWVRENNERYPLDRIAFNERLESRGLTRGRYGHTRARAWFGICRRIEAEIQSIPLDADMRTDADKDFHSFAYKKK